MPRNPDVAVQSDEIMTDLPIREPDQIRQDCARKIRVVQVSDHFQAILGGLLSEGWANRRIATVS